MFCVLVNFNVYFVYDFILNKNKNIRLPAQLYFVQINRKRNQPTVKLLQNAAVQRILKRVVLSLALKTESCEWAEWSSVCF